MSYRKNSDPLKTILEVVVGVVFCISLLAVSYKAFIGSPSLPTKAAENDIIVQQWEFDGTDTQGWKATNALTFGIKPGGLLELVVDPKVLKNPGPVTMYNNTTIQLPRMFLDYVKMDLKVQTSNGGGQMCVQGTAGCKTTPSPLVSPTPITYPITIQVHFQTKKVSSHKESNGHITTTTSYSDVAGSPLVMTGIANGQFNSYSAPIQNPSALANGMSFDRMVITIPELSSRPFTAMDIDWIRIVYPKPVTTPTPTPTSCTPNGSTCTISVCQPCSAGKVCPALCVAQQGVCANNVCLSTITKIGTVQSSNQNGQVIYTLVVSQDLKYQITMRTGNNAGLGQYVGKRVQVTGTLQQPKQVGMGIPENNPGYILVDSITIATPPPTLPPCTKDSDCPAGEVCSSVPPGGCPSFTDTKGNTVTPPCAQAPRCWYVPSKPTNVSSCNTSCSVNSDCPAGLVCSTGSCRNPNCMTQTSCSCSSGQSASPTPTSSCTTTCDATGHCLVSCHSTN